MRSKYKILLFWIVVVNSLAVGTSGCNMLNRLTGLPQNPQPKGLDQPKGDAANSENDLAHSLRLAPYVFIADFPLDRKMPLFQELTDLRERVYRELSLPDSDRIIKVYLFQSEDNYRDYMKKKYPRLPHRRAFFVSQPRIPGDGDDLLVYTWWGDQIEKDLRHELTHALLHSVLLDVPLWLDEGLAEYYETPPKHRGVHRQHLTKLRDSSKGRFQPDLDRLEKMTEMKEMSTTEYREAWAWVHFMLHADSTTKQILLRYLRELRDTDTPGSLHARLRDAMADPNQALLNHLQTISLPPLWTSAQR